MSRTGPACTGGPPSPATDDPETGGGYQRPPCPGADWANLRPVERYEVLVEYVDAAGEVVGAVTALSVVSPHLPRVGDSLAGLAGLPGPRSVLNVMGDAVGLPNVVVKELPKVAEVRHVVHVLSVGEHFDGSATAVVVRLPDPGLGVRRYLRDHEPDGWLTFRAVDDEWREDEIPY